MSVMSLDYEELMTQPYEPDIEQLISGALESAFWVMDSVILNDKNEFKITGDLVMLFWVTLYVLLVLHY